MKKISLLLSALLVLSSGLQAQRTCAAVEHLTQQLANDPTLAQRMHEIEEHTENFVRNNPKGTRAVITIPVVIHIVYKTTAENITDAQALSQIDVLNKDFRKLNADASSVPAVWSGLAADFEINFCMAQRTPTGAATTGIERRSTTVTSFGTNNGMKSYAQGGLDAWDATKYLNLWCCNIGGGILGYAQFPGGAASTDGVVIDYRYFGLSAASSAPYNKGRTGTHEVGHWLNLRHIWGDDGTACTGSDQVTDTPNQAGENYGVPTFPKTDACTSASPGVMFMNYMDYTDDLGMYMFTAGQKARAQALFATGGSRVGLVTSNGCTPPTTSTCATPTGVAVASITNTGATVSWAAVSGATSYQVLVGANTYTSATTSYTLSGLTACTPYSVTVKAVCGTTATSAASTAASFTTTGCTTPTCTSTYETNNTAATSKTIAINTNITSQIQSSGDIDWYSVTTTTAAPKVKITLTTLPLDYDVYLYASNGTTLRGSSVNSGTTSETIIYNTPKSGATYKIKVIGYNGVSSTSACYTLRASTQAANWRLGQDEGADGIKQLMEDMTVYPNPTDGIANLHFNVVEEDMNVNLAIIDQTGRIISTSAHTVTKSATDVELNFSDLSNGIYFLQVQNGDNVQIQKIVVAK